MADLSHLAEAIRRGERRAMAQALTLIDDRDRRAGELLHQLYRFGGKTRVVGLTGAPGSGKSTLADQLIQRLAARGEKVALLAVDPSSPFSGGAILGDRVRLSRSYPPQQVFVRSCASRGSLGGVSAAVWQMINVFRAAAFDTVLLETLGVGQSEIDVVEIADCVLLLLVPGLGDGVQMMKAGIMEIGDLYLINKCDRDGTAQLAWEVRQSLENYGQKKGAVPPLLMTQADAGRGVEELLAAIDRFFSQGNERLAARRKSGAEKELRRLLLDRLAQGMEARWGKSGALATAVERIAAGRSSPFAESESLLAGYRLEEAGPQPRAAGGPAAARKEEEP